MAICICECWLQNCGRTLRACTLVSCNCFPFGKSSALARGVGFLFELCVARRRRAAHGRRTRTSRQPRPPAPPALPPLRSPTAAPATAWQARAGMPRRPRTPALKGTLTWLGHPAPRTAEARAQRRMARLRWRRRLSEAQRLGMRRRKRSQAGPTRQARPCRRRAQAPARGQACRAQARDQRQVAPALRPLGPHMLRRTMKKRLSHCRRGPARRPRPRASRTPALTLALAPALPRVWPTASRLLRPPPRLKGINLGQSLTQVALRTSGKGRRRVAQCPAAALRLPAGLSALAQALQGALLLCRTAMLSAAMPRAPRQRQQLPSLQRADGRGRGACVGKQAHHQCRGRQQGSLRNGF